MLNKAKIGEIGNTEVVIMDSISQIAVEDRDKIVVSGSHGGVSSAQFALRQKAAIVFFNDAGIGKEEAGVRALQILQEDGIPAGAVSHDSAKIGDARDAWEHGVVSRVNDLAVALGIEPGTGLKESLATSKLAHPNGTNQAK